MSLANGVCEGAALREIAQKFPLEATAVAEANGACAPTVVTMFVYRH